MASTYIWNDALTVVKPFVKSIPTTVMDVTVCDQVNAFIWKRFDWRWAIFSLTSASSVLNLVDGTQDYGIGTTTGGGFYRLMRARITRTDQSPIIAREIEVVQWLAPNLNMKIDGLAMQAVAFEPVQSQLRLDAAASVTGSATYRIDGEYQAQPVKVTSTATTIVFPDQYFNVVIEGLKWKYYQLGDDKRAGAMVTDGAGRRSYSGQMGVFMAELEQMVEDEDAGGNTPLRFPEESLGIGKAGSIGWPGWR